MSGGWVERWRVWWTWLVAALASLRQRLASYGHRLAPVLQGWRHPRRRNVGLALLALPTLLQNIQPPTVFSPPE